MILLENSTVTVTRAAQKGTVGTESLEDEMCYLRVWKMNRDELIIVSRHHSSVQDSHKSNQSIYQSVF